jgi:hypothetical protein
MSEKQQKKPLEKAVERLLEQNQPARDTRDNPAPNPDGRIDANEVDNRRDLRDQVRKVHRVPASRKNG